MVALLIANGHQYQDILWEYTIAEVELFYSAVLRLKLERLRDVAIGSRVGMNADKNGWKKFMKDTDPEKREYKRKEDIDVMQDMTSIAQALMASRTRKDGR